MIAVFLLADQAAWGAGPAAQNATASFLAAQDTCPPDTPVECLDSDTVVAFCCYSDYPVCCYDGYFEEAWCCAEGYVCSGYIECTPEAETTTTTVPNGSSTITTAQGGGTDGNFLVAVNINGLDHQRAEFSGVLPGASPSVSAPLLYGRNGRPVPQWYDRQFPPVEPRLLEKTTASIKKRKSAGTFKISAFDVGDQKDFWVKDDLDPDWRQISATVMKSGDHSNIFVDNTLSISDATLEIYVTEFEVMVDIISDNIGEFSDRDGDGKVAILLYDFNDGGSIYEGYLGGYFWGKDYLDDSEIDFFNVRSNEMDIIYIRGDEPAQWEETGVDFYYYSLTTLVHEYQHLVHFGIKIWETQDFNMITDPWINEMMAMASETMYFKEKLESDPAYTHPSMTGGGYLSRRITYYNEDPENTIRNGHGLTYWDDNGDVLANYSLSYLFGQYLVTQSTSGQGIFKDILNYMQANGLNDYRAVAGAASQSISGVRLWQAWEDLLKNWAIANMANEPEGAYGYGGAFSLTPHGPTGRTVRMHNGGAVYRVFYNAAVTAPSFSGPNIRFYDGAGTTLSGSGTVCAAEQVLGRRSGAAGVLRRFRDEVLLDTGPGRELVELYYQHTETLSRIINENPDIRSDIASFFKAVLPLVRSAVRGEDTTINSATADAVNRLCIRMAEKADPALRKDILSLKSSIIISIESKRWDYE